MFGKPLTAKDWDRALGTAHGDAIVRLLMPFHELPIRLMPPMPHLDKEVPAAMLGLGNDAVPAAVVSRRAFQDAVDRLPEPARRGAAMGLVVGLAEAHDRALGDFLERTLATTPSFATARNVLQRSLFDEQIARLDRDFGKLSTTGLRLALQHVITAHVAAIADGRPDVAGKIEPFTRMFAAGNWPLGPMKGGGVIVLVE
jgi:hypothetical protein